MRYLVTISTGHGYIRTSYRHAASLYRHYCRLNPDATVRLWRCQPNGYSTIIQQQEQSR